MPMASTFKFLEEAVRPESLAAMREHAPGIIDMARVPTLLVDTVEAIYQLADKPFDAEGRKFLNDMPVTVAEAVRAAVVQAYDHGDRISLHYAPGACYSVKVTQWGVGVEHVVNVDIEGPTPEYVMTWDELQASQL